MRIWKFPLELTDTQQINVPLGTKILTAQIKDGEITMWGIVPLVPDCREAEPLTVEIHGTGTSDRPSEGLTYVGTVQSHAGLFVWHVFIKTEVG